MADSHVFAPDYDAPIEYMRRTREYYLALGYDNPYRWAHYVDAPFQPLKKKLSESTLALAEFNEMLADAAPHVVLRVGVVDPRERLARVPRERGVRDLVAAGAVRGVTCAGVVVREMNGDRAVLPHAHW